MTSAIEYKAQHNIQVISESQDEVPLGKAPPETAHKPAEFRVKKDSVKPGVVVLNKPEDVPKNNNVDEVKSKLDSDMDILIEMARCNQLMRQLGILLRDIENEASLAAQRDQVNKLKDSAKLSIGLAVVSGAMAVASAGIGIRGLTKNFTYIKQSKALGDQIDGRTAQMNTMQKNDPDYIKLADANAVDSTELKRLGQMINLRSEGMQSANAVTNATGGMVNASLQAVQGMTSADAKQAELMAASIQTLKQRVVEQIQNAENAFKELVQMLDKMSQNNAQAKRGIGTV